MWILNHLNMSTETNTAVSEDCVLSVGTERETVGDHYQKLFEVSSRAINRKSQMAFCLSKTPCPGRAESQVCIYWLPGRSIQSRR